MTAAKAKPHLLSDGLVGRESGEWAIDKLYYVGRYFDAFCTATKIDFPSRVYVDLLAGSGRCYLEHRNSEEFDGSPLLAAKVAAPFNEALLIEGAPLLADALRRRLAAYPSATVLEADCNAPTTIAQVRNFLGSSLGLVFADTLGLDTIALETLRQLTNGRRFDLIYTFHHHDATRNLQVARSSEAEGSRFESGLGPDWEDAWLRHLHGLGGASTISVGDALEGFFCQQLRSLGYEYVMPLPALMKNKKNAPLYRLILAAHHDLAIRLWKGISDIRADGQRTFNLLP